MFDWIAGQAFDSLWALVWHFGIIAGVVILALAWAWFMPVFKKTALWIALGGTIIFFTAGIYTKLGANYVQAKWDAANTLAIKDAVQARRQAEASTPPVVPGHPAKRLRNDGYDRDNQSGNAQGVSPHHLFKF